VAVVQRRPRDVTAEEDGAAQDQELMSATYSCFWGRPAPRRAARRPLGPPVGAIVRRRRAPRRCVPVPVAAACAAAPPTTSREQAAVRAYRVGVAARGGARRPSGARPHRGVALVPSGCPGRGEQRGLPLGGHPARAGARRSTRPAPPPRPPAATPARPPPCPRAGEARARPAKGGTCGSHRNVNRRNVPRVRAGPLPLMISRPGTFLLRTREAPGAVRDAEGLGPPRNGTERLERLMRSATSALIRCLA
jgi:hypothetical protein